MNIIDRLKQELLDENKKLREALEKILEEPKNTLSDAKALSQIIKIAKMALNK